MAWTTLSSSGAKLRASEYQSAITEIRPIGVIKAGDTSRSSTVSRTADPDLSVTLSPGEWELDALLLVTGGNAAGDFNFDWAFPADATLSSGTHGVLDDLASGTTAANVNVAGYSADTATPTGGHSIGASTSVTAVISHATVTIVTAGAVTIEWAQNSSNGTATVLKAGSKLTARKLS